MLNNISNKGKRAFFVPVFLCLLTLIAPIKATVEWAEETALDFLFSISHVEEITKSSVLILNKDQAFSDRFGEDPNRSHYASLLNLLKDAGAKVVAFDFIFNEAKNVLQDSQFEKSLKDFPYTYLAQHFVSRKKRGYSNLIKSSDSIRPPWPVKIYKPFFDASAGTGLINIFSGLDGEIHMTPLAFLPEEKNNFIPSLGFISWISHEFEANFRQRIMKIEAKEESLEAIENLLISPKFERRTLGHKGLDKLSIELEKKIALRYIFHFIKDKLELSSDDITSLKNTIRTSLQNKSWIDFPKSPLPIIGPDFAPCLRIPFQKSLYSQTGDSIESQSMSMFMKTKSEEATSDQLVSRNVFRPENIKSYNPNLSFNCISSSIKVGKVEGEIKTINNKPVIKADILICSEKNGFWAITKTDELGRFHLNQIPFGKYNFEINANVNSCQIISKLLRKITVVATSPVNVSLVSMPERSCKLRLDSSIASNSNLVVWGEPLNIFKTNKMGQISLYSMPSNHSLVPLADEYDDIRLVSGTIVLPSGKFLSNQNVAFLEKEEKWDHSFLSRSLSDNLIANDNSLRIPYALDCQALIESSNVNSSQTAALELEALPNNSELRVENLPIIKKDNAIIRFTPSLDQGSKDAKLIFIDQENNRFTYEKGVEVALKKGAYRVLFEDKNVKGMYNKFKTKLGNRPIFVGTSLDEDQDFVVSPINFMNSNNPRLPGVNIHANLCAALIDKRFLRPVFFHFDYCLKYWVLIVSLLTFPLMLLQSCVFCKKGAFSGAMFSLLISGLWITASVIGFKANILIPIVFPVGQLLCFAIALGFTSWAISRQKERETRNTFGRFISPDMVNEILHNPKALKPGGEKKELTIIFTDLAGFTTISEKLPPEKLTELMNEYLDEMTNILFKYQGTLDKYIGDAIMGFWNHPNKLENHPQLAAECAIEMQIRLKTLQKKWADKGLPALSMRVGLNTATCMVGFIGSKTQMNFTCLGDGVNLAARLEGANKPYGTLMMISDTVNNALDSKKIRTRFLDFLAVKGKIKPVKVYELIGYTSEDKELWTLIMPLYTKAHEFYLKQQWSKAINLFSEVLTHNPDDGLSRTYIERCEYYQKEPPPENWDGRFILKTK